ncbi:MAG: hypothetical protein IJ074_09825 [Clostridia bacterium]|nr:hypothetical protein [Clostridia bacterium]
MNLKKNAFKGLILLAAVVALCMFFSGTLRTITTAKVKIVRGKSGKLEQKTELTGKTVFPEEESIRYALGEGRVMVITKVNTRAGYTVQEGDVLVEGAIQDYDSTMKGWQDSYDEAVEQLMQLETKNSSLRLRRTDEQYEEAYYALSDARKAALDARVSLQTQLNQEELSMDMNGAVPEEGSEILRALAENLQKAEAAQEDAQTALDALTRYAPEDDVWTYLTEKRTLNAKLEDLEEKMLSLSELNAAVGHICAPHDGYVATCEIKAGDTYDGLTELLTISAENVDPVLRADISSIERVVNEGAVMTIPTDKRGNVETKVIAVGVDSDGKRYADVAITKDVTAALGSVYSMLQNDIRMVLTAKATQSTTLLNAAAVHGSGDDRYVFVVSTDYSSLGSSKLTVHKMKVTVLGEADGLVSVEEDMDYYDLAYMEDRPISDGDTVMKYMD